MPCWARHTESFNLSHQGLDMPGPRRIRTTEGCLQSHQDLDMVVLKDFLLCRNSVSTTRLLPLQLCPQDMATMLSLATAIDLIMRMEVLSHSLWQLTASVHLLPVTYQHLQLLHTLREELLADMLALLAILNIATTLLTLGQPDFQPLLQLWLDLAILNMDMVPHLDHVPGFISVTTLAMLHTPLMDTIGLVVPQRAALLLLSRRMTPTRIRPSVNSP